MQVAENIIIYALLYYYNEEHPLAQEFDNILKTPTNLGILYALVNAIEMINLFKINYFD